MRTWIQRLKEKKLVQWAAAYMALAWAILQVVDLVGGQFGWSIRLMQSITVMLVVGLGLTLVLAWYHGEKGKQRLGVLETLLIAALMTAGLFLLPTGSADRVTSIELERGGRRARAIAVLPFENLSPLADDAYFAAGMHDQVVSTLAKVSALIVVGRGPLMQTVQGERRFRQIANDLQVSYLLGGSVRRSETRVRLSAYLVEGATEAQIWSQEFDHDLTMENIFSVQDEVARRVAQALSAEILPSEAAEIAALPTTSLRAFDYLLRGNDLLNAFDAQGAVRMYVQAVELDPTFAAAHAALAQGYGWLYWGYDEDTLEQFGSAAERALALDSTLLDAHVALGFYHYWARADYDQALSRFRYATDRCGSGESCASTVRSPISPFAGRGAIERRLGLLRQALMSYAEALRVDPDSELLHLQIQRIYEQLREYDRALVHQERRLLFGPANEVAHWDAIRLRMLMGDERGARGALEVGRRAATPGPQLFLAEVYPPTLGILDVADLVMIADGVPDEAASASFNMPPQQIDENRARALELLGRRSDAMRVWDSIRSRAEANLPEPELDLRPLQRHYITLALAYSGLGRHEDAVAAAREAITVLPPSRDAIDGPEGIAALAEVYARSGRRDLAVVQLRELMRIPWFVSTAYMQLDVRWRPLQGHPAFLALLDEYREN